MKSTYSKWLPQRVDSFVASLTNGAFRRFCDSSITVWRHKVKKDCYRITVDGSVENVLLDEVGLDEVIEFLEDEQED